MTFEAWTKFNNSHVIAILLITSLWSIRSATTTVQSFTVLGFCLILMSALTVRRHEVNWFWKTQLMIMWSCDHVYRFRRIIISMISVCKIWDSWGWTTSSQNWYNLNIAGRRFFWEVGACGNTWTWNPNSSKFQNFSAPKSWSPNMTFGWTLKPQTSVP